MWDTHFGGGVIFCSFSIFDSLYIYMREAKKGSFQNQRKNALFLAKNMLF
jgi:hypothetical protein